MTLSPLYFSNIKSYFGSFALMICIVYAIHPDVLFFNLNGGLDNSWQMALQMATQKGMVFGDDIVFTYGPLAFFSTRCPINMPRLIVVCCDLFVMANIVYILLGPLKKASALEIFIVFCALFLLDFFVIDWTPTVYMILGYYLINNLEKQNSLEIAIAAFLSLVIFFVKLNFGLFSILMFSLYAAYVLAFFQHWRNYMLLLLVAYVGAFIASLYLLKVDLVGYLANSIEIVKGYQAAMYFGISDQNLFYLKAASILSFVLAGLLVIDFVFFFKKVNWKINRSEVIVFLQILFKAFFIASTCYVLFKQSFVRADIGHFPTFFKFVVPLMGMLLLHSSFPFQSWLRRAVIVALAVVVVVVELDFSPGLRKRNTTRFESLKNYYASLKTEPAVSPARYSQYVQDLVSKESVDIFPTEVSMAFFNDLNYKPRPVFQSYSVYTEKLDQINAESLKKTDAPSFLIASPGSIDGRYFMWDESKTKFEILKNYDARLVEGDIVVYEKRAQPRAFKVIQQDTFKLKFGEYRDLKPSKGLRFARFIVKPTLKGHVRSLFYQPPDLNAAFQLKNGTEVSVRAVSNIISSGVLMNKYVAETNDDVLAFHLTQGHGAEDILRIKMYSNLPGMFKDEVLVETTDVLVEDPGPTLTKKLSAEELNNGKDKIKFWIDKAEVKSNCINIVGWAFIKDRDSRDLTTRLILSSGGEDIVSESVVIPRNDVARFFGSKFDWDRAGFKAVIDRNRLKNDTNYKLSLSILDKQGNVIASCEAMDINIPID
ncbi:hypothetical protein WBG78_17965 [Chryseolinea sp. T2]|uniref:hypothetical protein n=1 Tax=Chryseolinea sp. T2 TaxID=3129255 RepID=UPI0030775044